MTTSRTHRWWRACWLAVLGTLVGVALAYAAGPGPEASGPRGPATRPDRGYTDINPAQLRSMLENQDFLLVNVHIPYEGELEGTDVFLPFDAVEANLGTLANKDAKLVVYCRSGRMSTIAATRLVDLGYTDVWHLAGGMTAWTTAGYPLVWKAR